MGLILICVGVIVNVILDTDYRIRKTIVWSQGAHMQEALAEEDTRRGGGSTCITRDHIPIFPFNHTNITCDLWQKYSV